VNLNKQALAKYIPAILTVAIWSTYPFTRVNNCLIWVLGFYFLYTARPYEPLQVKRDILLLLPVVFFVAYLFGMFWASDPHEGWIQIEKRLSLIALPALFFFGRNKLTKEDATRMMYAFVLVCLGMSVVCYVNALRNVIVHDSFTVINERNYYYFSYMPLTTVARIDPIYASLYTNFSILILLFRPIRIKWLGVVALVYFVIFNLLVASKVGILVLMAIFVLFVSSKIKNKIIVVGVIVFMAMSFFAALTRVAFLKDRFIASTTFNYELPWSGNWNSTSQRLAIWTCAVETIQKNFPLGYGTADGQEALHATYVKNRFVRGYEDDYNAHNEFLYTWLDLGVFGFIILMTMIVLPAKTAIKNRDPLFFSFIMICSLYFLVEVVLTRRAGMNFFCFFYSLLAVNDFICKRNAVQHDV